MEVGVMAKVARRGWIFGWVWYTLGLGLGAMNVWFIEEETS